MHVSHDGPDGTILDAERLRHVRQRRGGSRPQSSNHGVVFAERLAEPACDFFKAVVGISPASHLEPEGGALPSKGCILLYHHI